MGESVSPLTFMRGLVKKNVQEVFKHYLSRRGLKSTRQRDIILSAFIDLNRHTYVDELYLALRDEHPGVGHVTVYRALKLFAESGIAREIHFGDGITRYECLTGGQHHDHLVCTVCGTITEFENCVTTQLREATAKSLGFQIESLKIELRGVCRECLSKPRPQAHP
jgi:Fur family transcriptional regulator, ferric uptake regulator